MKSSRIYKKVILVILAVALILAAVPVGMLTEVGVNGCCGAPSTSYKGIGFLLMGALFITGLTILIVALKHSKK